jgi:hypothetical protein
MVSGHLFHCRKNSWPPEEYVARTALQLVRRALVSIAKTFFSIRSFRCFVFWVVALRRTGVMY